ncbi:MAG: diphosphomevalonate decarboxylase [Flavobacteriales bacterium]|nr:diphosphomevalonate decarboxylase [Flavobacteriales bacterium]
MQTEQKTDTKKIEKARVEYRSPSNIALVKYWGKMGLQLPMNPSISFTLSQCATTTSVEFELAEAFSFAFFFEGEAKPDFHPKLSKFFDRIEREFPPIRNYKLTIRSSNSFPHSSGIASSASAFSALALCIADFEKQYLGEGYPLNFQERASHWARLGSGSACRSVFGGVAMWGYSPEFDQSSDKFAVQVDDIHPVFKDYQDTVLLVDKGEKTISSTVGHDLMNGHPYTSARIAQAHDNLVKIVPILRNGNLEEFVKLVENEALSLHAMMLTSDPGYFLIKANTLKIIGAIRGFREQNGISLCFTLDAGANVHVLYPAKDKKEVLGFIESDVLAYCQNGEYICDEVGKGPQNMSDKA